MGFCEKSQEVGLGREKSPTCPRGRPSSGAWLEWGEAECDGTVGGHWQPRLGLLWLDRQEHGQLHRLSQRGKHGHTGGRPLQAGHGPSEDALQTARPHQPETRVPGDHQVSRHQPGQETVTLHYRDVASEMKLLLDSAGRLAPNLPDHQRAELDLARRKLLETSRSFSNALKAYFKTPE